MWPLIRSRKKRLAAKSPDGAKKDWMLTLARQVSPSAMHSSAPRPLALLKMWRSLRHSRGEQPSLCKLCSITNWNFCFHWRSHDGILSMCPTTMHVPSVALAKNTCCKHKLALAMLVFLCFFFFVSLVIVFVLCCLLLFVWWSKFWHELFLHMFLLLLLFLFACG